MKTRIKIDLTLLFFIIGLTLILCLFPQLYSRNEFFENIMDVFGIMMIFKGTFFRMSARAHKKFNSQSGQVLVEDGPYAFVRNPMYLGSLLIGLGFTLILWPWWGWLIFAVLFYWRFGIQIAKEETYLQQTFGQQFLDYCQKVPRLFPRITNLNFRKSKEMFCSAGLWSTQEKWGLVAWPILTFVFEIMQERMLFGVNHFRLTFFIFLSAWIFCILGLMVFCQRT